MNKITIFWNGRLSDRFYWCSGNSVSDGGNSTQSTSDAVHELESHELLKADLSALADTLQGKKVELILSSSDIHFSQVELPNKAQRHLRKAVPYLLEEQLSAPVDDVFIAIGERLKNNNIPVRVIDKAYFEQVIEQFQLAEIKLDSIRIDLDLVDKPDAGYFVVFINEWLLITEETGYQWSCELDDFSWLVQKRLIESLSKPSVEQMEVDSDLPVALPMLVVTDNTDTYRLFEKSLPVGVFAPQSKIVSSAYEMLAESKQAPFNMLQAEYELKIENSPLKNMLKSVASIAAIIFVAHIAYQTSQIIALKQQQASLTEQRNMLRKQGFPNQRRVTDKTLSTFLKNSSGGAEENSFLSMLQSTSEKIGDLAELYPTNISYDSARNELRLDVIGKNLGVLDKYRDELSNSGYEVEKGSATQRGDSYSSRLIIRK
jgi:general secretion pathway protein L